MLKEHKYWNIINNPISEDSIYGKSISTSSDFDKISDEMLKFGSLDHANINWDVVEKNTVDILKNKSRDVVVFRYFIQMLSNKSALDNCLCSIYLTYVFIDKWEDKAFPRSKNDRIKKVNIEQIFKIINGYVKKLADTESIGSIWSDIQKYLDLLIKLSNDKGTYEIQELLAANKTVNNVLSRYEDSENNDENINTEEVQKINKPNIVEEKKEPIATPKNILFDDDRNAKRSIISVANFLSDMDINDRTAFILRRVAIWLNILSVPPINKNGNTEIRPPSIEVIDNYEEMLQQPSMDSLSKLEKSLINHPFWLYGHYLAFKFAEKMEKSDIAFAIRNETSRFVDRLPDLLNINFFDGTKVLDDNVKQWLSGNQNINLTEEKQEDNKNITVEYLEIIGKSWQSDCEKAIKLAKNDNFIEAIKILEDINRNSNQPRVIFYTRLIISDIYSHYGAKEIALNEYKRLLENANSLNLQSWEPNLVNRLNKAIEKCASKP